MVQLGARVAVSWVAAIGLRKSQRLIGAGEPKSLLVVLGGISDLGRTSSVNPFSVIQPHLFYSFDCQEQRHWLLSFPAFEQIGDGADSWIVFLDVHYDLNGSDESMNISLSSTTTQWEKADSRYSSIESLSY